MTKILGLFPGQGSQQVGMGAAFCESSELAREIFTRADRSLGFSLSKLCFSGPIEALTLTMHAQPAILCSSYACYLAAGLPLSAAAGHSLGEYTALVAAEALSFEDAVQIVHQRGRYMQEAVPSGTGAMAAVMGPSEIELRALLAQLPEPRAEIANLNSPGQTVIAGSTRAVAEFCEVAKKSGAKVIPLNVSAPFHCQLMAPAAEKLGTTLRHTVFKEPRFPVYSNVTARAITTAAQIPELLIEQVTASVRWTEQMQNIVAEIAPNFALEFGPGGVLSKLLKRIDRSLPGLEVHDPASLSATRQALVV